MNNDRLKYRFYEKRPSDFYIRYEFDDDYIIQHGQVYEMFYDYSEPSENIIACQCTGLKDKNDKEIFEGDILIYGAFALNDRQRFGDSPLPEGVDEMDTTTVFKILKVEWNFIELAKLREYVEENPDVEGVKIIGNIYENPELLND